MKVRELHEPNERVLVAVFAKGEEFLAGMEELARELQLTGASFSAIGAFSSATLGFFRPSTKDYAHIVIDEQVEVLTLAGNIALSEGKPKVHAHVVIGTIDGTARGGHILEARVWPTLEVVLTETAADLRRHIDPETGLALIRL